MSRRRLLASFLVGAAVLWGTLLAPLNRPRVTIAAPADGNPAPALFFSPDSSQLVTVHFQRFHVGEEPFTGNHGSARVWDVASGQLVATLTDRDRLINSVAFAPDGSTVAGRQENGRIIVWNRSTGEMVGEHAEDWLRRDAHPNTQVVYAPDGRLLYQNAQVWTRMHDVATGTLEFDFTEKKEPFNSATVRIQNFFLAAGTPGAVAFRIDTGEVHAVFETNGVTVDTNGALSQNGRCFAVWQRDDRAVRDLLVWTPSGRETLRIAPQMPGAISNDGRWLATIDAVHRQRWLFFGPQTGEQHGIVVITDTSTGRERATLSGTPSVAFAPDDRTLAVSQESGAVQLWDFPLRTRWEWIVPASAAAAVLTYWLTGLRRRTTHPARKPGEPSGVSRRMGGATQ